MKIIQVHFRRTWNLGNYESASVELVAELDDEDDVAKEVLGHLKREADSWRRSTEL